MKTVKFSYVKGDESRWGAFERQSHGRSGRWGDYQFIFDDTVDECDYWVVYDIMPKTETCKCPEKNTIFVTGEPPHIGAYPAVFLNQFNHIITCHNDIIQSKLIKGNKYRYQQSLPWLINKTYDELIDMEPIEKPKLLSLITTTKHKDRYKAAMAIKDHFGDNIDLYGDGINPVKNKWDAIAPYKYSIVMENTRIGDYFTEKLTDCYLTYTFPFYYGCNNLDMGWFKGEDAKYFSQSSFCEIYNLDYTEQICHRIEKLISNKLHYDSALPSIMESRAMVLNKFNIYPSIINYIENNKQKFENDLNNKVEITLSDKGRFVKDKTMFLKKLWRSLC